MNNPEIKWYTISDELCDALNAEYAYQLACDEVGVDVFGTSTPPIYTKVREELVGQVMEDYPEYNEDAVREEVEETLANGYCQHENKHYK
jgi:hypothetical protein